jgi:hypothetical protein
MSTHNRQCPVDGCGVWSNRWGGRKTGYPLPPSDVFTLHLLPEVDTAIHNRICEACRKRHIDHSLPLHGRTRRVPPCPPALPDPFLALLDAAEPSSPSQSTAPPSPIAPFSPFTTYLDLLVPLPSPSPPSSHPSPSPEAGKRLPLAETHRHNVMPVLVTTDECRDVVSKRRMATAIGKKRDVVKLYDDNDDDDDDEARDSAAVTDDCSENVRGEGVGSTLALFPLPLGSASSFSPFSSFSSALLFFSFSCLLRSLG